MSFSECVRVLGRIWSGVIWDLFCLFLPGLQNLKWWKREGFSIAYLTPPNMHIKMSLTSQVFNVFSSTQCFSKGHLNSEWIYEVIVSPKMATKTFPDFCPTKQTRIVALFLVSVGSFFGYDPCLFGRAEIWKSFGCHFGRNDDFINSFWI